MRYFFLIVGLLATTPLLAASFDSHLHWKTLKSPHFSVHFHDGEEALAQQTLAIAEEVHQTLSPLFEWLPAEPTQIVLSDNTDIANGSATPFPYNRINLYATSSYRGGDHERWLQMLIVHEYVHILHLDKALAAPKFLRRIFGRHVLLFPNLFQPAWGLEGLATYYETSVAGGYGRGQSSEFDMLMRMEVAGGIKPISQINQTLASWPGGKVRYLYGVDFYKFIADKYGENKVQALVKAYSDNLIPYRLNGTSNAVFGLYMNTLYREFEIYLKDKHVPRLEAIRRQGVVAGEAVTHEAYGTEMPALANDGTLYFVSRNGRDIAHLKRLPPGGATPEALLEVNTVAGLDVHEHGGIIFSQAELCRSVNRYFDLYHLDPDSGKSKRLTHCARLLLPVWSDDGRHLIAVQNSLANQALVLLNAAGVVLKTLWQGQAGEIISGLDWAPDGERVLASIWRPEGGWNLEEFLLKEERWRLLTADSALELDPQYTRDGRALVYTADYDGVYNLRRMALDSGEISTLTNVEGGAFSPRFTDDDGPLYYLAYGPKGRDIYRLDAPFKNNYLPSRRLLAPQKKPPTKKPSWPVFLTNFVPYSPFLPIEPASSWLPPVVTPVLRQPPRWQDNLGTHAGASAEISALPNSMPTAVAQPYSPWNGLKPRWWSPYLLMDNSRTEVGVMTSAWDALRRHYYATELAYDLDNSHFVGEIDYVYNRWHPTLTLRASRWNNLFYGIDDRLARLRRTDTLMAAVSYPWLRMNHRLALHLSLYRETNGDIWLAQNQRPLRTFTDDVVSLALTYDTTKRQPLGVSRQGRNALLMVESNDVLGEDFTGEVYTLDWREFIPLPFAPGHTLGLRFAMGWGTDISRWFKLGGSDSAASNAVFPDATAVAMTMAPSRVRNYALRGYPSGLWRLSGRRMALMSAEWRFPLRLIERGLMRPPMGIHRLSGALFVDNGDAWRDDPEYWATGAGAELIVEANLFYQLNFSMRLGYAHGFDKGGENEFYLKLGTAF